MSNFKHPLLHLKFEFKPNPPLTTTMKNMINKLLNRIRSIFFVPEPEMITLINVDQDKEPETELDYNPNKIKGKKKIKVDKNPIVGVYKRNNKKIKQK